MSWCENNTPLTGGGGLAKDITGIAVRFSRRGLVYWNCWWWVVQGHHWNSGVLLSHKDTSSLGGGLLELRCPNPLLEYVCVVLTPGNSFDIGCWGRAVQRRYWSMCVLFSHQNMSFLETRTVGGGGPSNTCTGVVLCCPHTRAFSNFDCWAWVVQGRQQPPAAPMPNMPWNGNTTTTAATLDNPTPAAQI